MTARDLWRRTTAADRWLVLLLAVGALVLLFLQAGAPPGARVIVEREGRVLFTAPLDQERTVRLEGPLGVTVLKIEEGRACVLDSPCPLKVCIGMGEVAREGELLACVPNRLLVRIEGGRGGGEPYDLLSR